MKWKAGLVISLGYLFFVDARPSNQHIISALGPQGVNLVRLRTSASARASQSGSSGRVSTGFELQDGDIAAAGEQQKPFAPPPELKAGDNPNKPEFRAQWFRQPLDHFNEKSKRFFHQRYWVNTRHYKPRKGAPVIVLDGGETSGEDRIPFLDTGIVDILAKATGGVGVVLEHRYYGESIPVANFSTDSLRFLNNAQSAADSANFLQNAEFDGIEEDLRATNTPWIYYGGSYAGARAAHMKILYPDLVWGGIASSAVTHASLQNWQYMDLIRQAADSKCSDRLVKSIDTIDKILEYGKPWVKKQLKGLFGLAGLEKDDDFASVLEAPLGSWQSKCWDPQFGSNTFDEFCSSLGGPFGLQSDISQLEYGHPKRMVKVGKDLAVDASIVQYGRWIKKHVVADCPADSTVQECFGTYDAAKYSNIGLDQDWRLWLFQVCTEWGYFVTAPPDMKLPRIVSKLITLGYESKICKLAFPAGDHFQVPQLPNITVVNELGDFDIAADRLAIIDGDIDPWKPMTPHSDDASDRTDTTLRPFKLIPGGVHHYDEYGWKNILEEPAEIRKIHLEMIEFVRSWLEDWNELYGGEKVW